MVLESVAAGISVGVAAKIRQDEHGGFACVLRLLLNRLPDFRAKAVGAAYAFDIERVCAGVRDVDVVQCNPEQAGRKFAHELTRKIDR